MEPIRTLVVDDEPLAAELVKDYVASTPFLSFVGCCSNASDALEVIKKGGADLVFLDIQMPGMSGLSMAKAIMGAGAPKVVFTTAYNDYAIDGFRVNAIDYLLKPFDYDEFLRAANKVRALCDLESNAESNKPLEVAKPVGDNDLGNGGKSFFVKSEYRLVRIDADSVTYVEGLKDYVKIHIEDQPKAILTLSTMKAMESKLEKFSFVRLHRSFIVNLSKISGFERGAVLVGGQRIPVGDGYKQKLGRLIAKMTI